MAPGRRTLYVLPASLVTLLILITGGAWLYEITKSPPVQVYTDPVVTPSTQAEDTFSRDMLSLAQLLEQQNLLVLHGLNTIAITPDSGQFELTSSGSLIPTTTLMRLRELAQARGTTLQYDGETWTIQHASSRYTAGDPAALSDLYPQLDRWRLIATIHDMHMRFVRKETLHDSERYFIHISMAEPLSAKLRALAADVHSQNLKARTENVSLDPASGDRWGRGWDSITIEFSITGTTQ